MVELAGAVLVAYIDSLKHRCISSAGRAKPLFSLFCIPNHSIIPLCHLSHNGGVSLGLLFLFLLFLPSFPTPATASLLC